MAIMAGLGGGFEDQYLVGRGFEKMWRTNLWRMQGNGYESHRLL